MAGRTYRIQYQLDGDAKGAVRSMKVTEAELKKLRKGQTDAAEGSKRLRGDTEQLDRRLGAMAASATRGALALVGIGTAAATVGLAVRRELQFERTFSTIEGLVGLTRDEVDSLSASVRALAPEVGIATQQLADAAFFVTSAGFRGAEAMDVLTASARASAAGLGETKAIVDTVTSAVNAFRAQGLEAADATDVLVAAVRAGKLEADTLGPALSKVLGTASALGVTFADVAGTLAVFSRTGTSAEVGATQINAILGTLLGTSQQGVDALDAVGLSLENLRSIAVDDGLVGVMRTLDDAFQGNLEQLRLVVPNVEAFRGVLNALSQDASSVQGVLDDVRDATGSLDSAYAAAARTGSFQMQQQQELLNAEMDKFAQQVMPGVLAGANGLVGYINDSFVPAIQGLGEAVARGTGNIVPDEELTRLRQLRELAIQTGNSFEEIARARQIEALKDQFPELRESAEQNVRAALAPVLEFIDGLTTAGVVANDVIIPLRAAGDAVQAKGEKSKGAAAGVNELTAAEKGLQANIALGERQLALMAQGLDSNTAAMQAQIEAATGLDRELLLVNQRVAEAVTGETEAARAARELEAAITGLREQALTPTERALEAFEAQMATLQDGLAAGLIDPAEFAQVAERLKAQYWDKITGDGRKAADDVGKSVTDLQAELDGLSFGNQFAQGFDDASRAAGEFLDGINGLIEAQSTFNELRSREGITAAQIAQINRAEAAKQIGLYGDMTQAAKGFFDEGSDGYKALTAAEQAFRVFELTIAAQNLAAKLGLIGAETAAVTTAAAVKASAEGTAAVASAGVGLPFPANLAAIGATVAALASFGVLLSGGGGGGGAAGALDSRGASGLRTSGTILGDPEAASESITNALDRASEIADADLTQSRLMVQSLRNIETALVGVTSEFARIAGERGVQSFALQGTAGASSVDVGGFAPSFEAAISNVFGNSGIIESERERFNALADRARIGIELGVAEIFDGMSQVVGEAATTFGADRDAAIAAFQAIDISGIEFRESDNVEQAIAEFVSGLGDSAVEQLSAMLGINVDALQRAGEGLFDTLTRVYAEVEVARSGLDRIDSGLGDLDPNRLIAISSALIDAAGGMTEFIDLTKGFVDAFRTESQQLEIAQREATDAIAQLGFALPGTREEFAALVDSVTVTDRASAQLKVGLLALVPALDDLYGLTEDIAADALDVRRAFGLAASEFDDTLSSLGLAADALPDTNEGMRQFIDRLTEADQAALRPFIGDLQNLITATEDAAEATRDATRATVDSIDQINRSAERADELAARRARVDLQSEFAERIRESNREAEQAARDAQAAALSIGDSATAYAQAWNIALGEIRNSGASGGANAIAAMIGQRNNELLFRTRQQLVNNAISAPSDLTDLGPLERVRRLFNSGELIANMSGLLVQFRQFGGEIPGLTGRLDLFFGDLSRAAENLAAVSGNVTAAVDGTSTALQRLTNIVASVDAATAAGNTSDVADLIADAAMRAQQVIAARADEVLQAAVTASVGINDVAALDAALVQMFDLLAKGRIDAAQFESAFDLAVGQFQGLTDAVEAVADAVRSADDILRERLGLERQLLELQGDTAALRALDRAAIDESNLALFDQISALRDAKDAEQALAQARTDAASALRQAFDRESAVLQGRIDQFGGISDALGDFARGLRGEIAADGGLDIARSRFEDIARRAQVGDLAALEQFAGAGNDYAGLLRDSTLSQEQYVRELAAITRATDAAQGVANRQGSIAEQQLDALTNQVSALIEINDSVLTVAQAIDDLNAVGLVPQPAQSSITAPQSLSVTPFVQPTGTAPSGSTDNASLIAEVRLLRQELQAIKSNTGSTASNTDQINVTFRRVTQEGDGVTVYSGEEVSVLAA